jgi:hypothetical protein
MVTVTLKIKIEIDNYEEVIHKHAGSLASFLLRVPILRSIVKHKANKKIVEKLKLGFVEAMPKEIESKFAEEGVKAKVEVYAD